MNAASRRNRANYRWRNVSEVFGEAAILQTLSYFRDLLKTAAQRENAEQ